MTKQAEGGKGEAGSALIEVLVAMVLLALTMVSIHPPVLQSAKLVRTSAQQSEHTSVANSQLELALLQLRCGGACGEVNDTAWALSAADSVFLAVESLGTLYTVTVTVRANPLPSEEAEPRGVTLTGHVFVP